MQHTGHKVLATPYCLLEHLPTNTSTMTIYKGDKLVPMAGGIARAAKLTPEQLSAIASKAVTERWRKYHAKQKESTKQKPKAQKAG